MPPTQHTDLSWPSWLPNPFASPPPAEDTTPYVPPASTTQSPEENARAIVDRYLRWGGAGGKTVNVGKNDKGQDTYQPVDPDTGKPDPDFPTEQQFDAARAYLASRAGTGPSVVNTQPSEQFIIKSDGTVTKNPNYVPPRPSVVGTNTADQFIVKDDGSRVSNPNYVAPRPTVVQTNNNEQFIVRQNTDGTVTRDANPNYRPDMQETPAQASARRTSESQAQIRATSQARIDELLAPYKAGVKLTDEEDIRLRGEIERIRDEANAAEKARLSQEDFERNQPNKDRELAVAEQNAATSRQTATQNSQYQQGQLDRQSRQDQAGALYKQADAGQGVLNMAVKAGVAPSMATVKLAYNPIQQALSLMGSAVKNGNLPASAIPQSGPPQPDNYQDQAEPPAPY